MPTSKLVLPEADPPRRTLLEERQEAVRQFQSGVPVMQIVATTGMSWQGVRTAIDLFKAGGEAALKPAARGRKPGTGRSLTPEQEAEVRALIRARRPSFYGLQSSLWSREKVHALVAAKLSLAISTRSLTDYLQRWGLAVPGEPREPVKRCSPAVREWLATHYSQIVPKAKATNALIYWVNRPVKLNAQLWSVPVDVRRPEAGLPIQQVTPTPRRMVSVSNNQGKLLWVVCSGNLSVQRQATFLGDLFKDSGRRKIFLIGNGTKEFTHCEVSDRIRTMRIDVEVLPPPSEGEGDQDDQDGLEADEEMWDPEDSSPNFY